jgi:hypothetical protein
MAIALSMADCGDGEPSRVQAAVDAGDEEVFDTGPEGEAEGGTDTGAGDVMPEGPELVDLVLTVLEFSAAGAEGKPLPGATVAVDLADGSRVEVVSDAGGKIQVLDAGTEEDSITLVAHKQGYEIWSWETPLAQAMMRPRIPLYSLTAVPSVTVSGTATGMTSTAHQLLVMSNAGSVSSKNAGPDFSLQVHHDRPFSLMGLEFSACASSCARCVCQTFHQWTRTNHEALTGDATVVLDFSVALEPIQTQGTIELPAREDSRLRTMSFPYVQVLSFGSSLSHGYSLSMNLEPDENSFSYLAEYVEWEGAPDVTTVHFLLDNARMVQSRIYAPGYPQPNAFISGFLDVPDVVSPAGHQIGLLDSFEWVPRETTDAKWILARDGQTVWTHTASAASRLSLPQPPSSVDLQDLLGTEILDGYFALLAHTDPINDVYEKALIMYGYKVTP